MTREEIINKLKREGIVVQNEKEVANGINLYFSNDSNVVLYTKSGKYVPGGKGASQTKKILDNDSKNVGSKDVFVVYGHDNAARDELELILRRWGLNPIILCQQSSTGMTIIEALEHYIKTVNYGVVLATPDDIGYDKEKESNKKYRARQNVVFEMGMLYAYLQRQNVFVLLKETTDLEMEKPSDIDGIIYEKYVNKVSECTDKLGKALKSKGYILED